MLTGECKSSINMTECCGFVYSLYRDAQTFPRSPCNTRGQGISLYVLGREGRHWSSGSRGSGVCACDRLARCGSEGPVCSPHPSLLLNSRPSPPILMSHQDGDDDDDDDDDYVKNTHRILQSAVSVTPAGFYCSLRSRTSKPVSVVQQRCL